MNETIGYNVHNTNAHAVKTGLYVEDHQLSRIYEELLVLANRDRPKNMDTYVARNIVRIGNSVENTRTTLLVPPDLDAKQLAIKYREMYNCPIIQYTRARTEGDTAEVLKKLGKFLKFHGIYKKHLIAFNFPGNRREVIEAATKCFEPTNVIQLIPDDKALNKECICGAPPTTTITNNKPDSADYLDDFKQVKDYFSDRTVELNISGLPKKRKQVVGSTATCKNINHLIRQPLSHINHRMLKSTSTDKWYPRIVLIGRRGSGRKTQAALLAKKLGLIFIDVEVLVLQYIQQQDSQHGESLRIRSRNHSKCTNPMIMCILHKRLMQPDCLHNGWVVVGFPLCVDDAKKMDEEFTVTPNRIIFLHCRVRECKRRMLRFVEKIESASSDPQHHLMRTYSDPKASHHTCDGVHLMQHPSKAFACIEKEHVYYSLQIRDLVAYYDYSRPVSHVNATRSVMTVHQELLNLTMHPKIPLFGEQANKDNA